jgi:hypothetical protein
MLLVLLNLHLAHYIHSLLCGADFAVKDSFLVVEGSSVIDESSVVDKSSNVFHQFSQN